MMIISQSLIAAMRLRIQDLK